MIFYVFRKYLLYYCKILHIWKYLCNWLHSNIQVSSKEAGWKVYYIAVIHVERFTILKYFRETIRQPWGFDQNRSAFWLSYLIVIIVIKNENLLYLFWSEMKIGTTCICSIHILHIYVLTLSTLQLYCVNGPIVAKLCLCFVMYDVDENNITKLFVLMWKEHMIKMIWYYKHTINLVMVNTMSVIERIRKRKLCLLMQNRTLPKRDILCPWMS